MNPTTPTTESPMIIRIIIINNFHPERLPNKYDPFMSSIRSEINKNIKIKYPENLNTSEDDNKI